MTAPRMRAGTADRQATVDQLTRHFTEGRLNPGEFDERVGQAYAATHLDELPALLADLPDDDQHHRRQPAPSDGKPARWPADGWSPSPRSRELQHTPPQVFAVEAVVGVVAMVFTVGALTHGFFPFPLLWIVLIGLFLARGRGHRRRAHSERRVSERWNAEHWNGEHWKRERRDCRLYR